MIEITRDEFLNFALIPDIAHAKEVNWFKSNKMADKLGIIIQIDSNKKYDYLIYQKDKAEDYILYPNDDDFSSDDYKEVYCELEKKMI
ncbi:hypothetical protein [Legionella jamestowniensis]|uniref:Uncharacterized protein n=1 Tax=Legionella jamestowniensis TaxID=455 RepID=A0A0W0UI18_9GAMM|nr:hypothetical protein [Legionella jamestowniensis]KTD07547.1 hypothetical protein Ljam_1742 [Legionella jamestowniensis]OCH97684.1 hypothetical protein A8135_02265 [Legionella jamestowniensis]SFM01600.1 hypothetical protein SAMN02746073_3072 [Legionella jamestowniensis DSM 19215]